MDDAYSRFFKRLGSHPKFKKKNHKNSYRTNCIRNSYKGHNYSNIEVDMKRKVIKLPKLDEIKIRGYRKLEELPGRIIHATVLKDGKRYYVSLCVEENIDIPEFKLRTAIGIDLGVKNLVITSDGLKYQYACYQEIREKNSWFK